MWCPSAGSSYTLEVGDCFSPLGVRHLLWLFSVKTSDLGHTESHVSIGLCRSVCVPILPLLVKMENKAASWAQRCFRFPHFFNTLRAMCWRPMDDWSAGPARELVNVQRQEGWEIEFSYYPVPTNKVFWRYSHSLLGIGLVRHKSMMYSWPL